MGTFEIIISILAILATLFSVYLGGIISRKTERINNMQLQISDLKREAYNEPTTLCNYPHKDVTPLNPLTLTTNKFMIVGEAEKMMQNSNDRNTSEQNPEPNPPASLISDRIIVARMGV